MAEDRGRGSRVEGLATTGWPRADSPAQTGQEAKCFYLFCARVGRPGGRDVAHVRASGVIFGDGYHSQGARGQGGGRHCRGMVCPTFLRISGTTRWPHIDALIQGRRFAFFLPLRARAQGFCGFFGCVRPALAEKCHKPFLDRGHMCGATMSCPKGFSLGPAQPAGD